MLLLWYFLTIEIGNWIQTNVYKIFVENIQKCTSKVHHGLFTAVLPHMSRWTSLIWGAERRCRCLPTGMNMLVYRLS
jgi:hypothetical protein